MKMWETAGLVFAGRGFSTLLIRRYAHFSQFYAMTYSPLQEIFPPHANVRVFLKRDDLLHPSIQGNKWRKLAPFIQNMGNPKPGVISFGGAFSNHLHALAAAGKLFGFPTYGVVRGMAADLDNPTLSEARACGMQIFPVPKTNYEVLKKADCAEIVRYVGLKTREPLVVLPEGGDTIEALVGCKAIAVEIREQLPPDARGPVYFCVPAGTGCTAAGVIAGMQPGDRTLVFPAAPYGVDEAGISAKLQVAGFGQQHDFQIMEDVEAQKFAHMTEALLVFCRAFERTEGIVLDPVYTSKMMLKLYGMLAQQFFPAGSSVVAVHTGGLQGWNGMRQS